MQCSGTPWEALGGLRDAILRNPLEQSLEYLQVLIGIGRGARRSRLGIELGHDMLEAVAHGDSVETLLWEQTRPGWMRYEMRRTRLVERT